jgi:hypothetical protein
MLFSGQYFVLEGHLNPVHLKENQHKTLENISESHEKCSIGCGPGERIITLSDSQRCSIVRKGPIRPEMSDEECPKDEKADILVPFTTTEF